MTKVLDPDIIALGGAIRALDGSSSLKMLAVNMEFLWDRYIAHPNSSIVEHFAVKTRVTANQE